MFLIPEIGNTHEIIFSAAFIPLRQRGNSLLMKKQ